MKLQSIHLRISIQHLRGLLSRYTELFLYIAPSFLELCTPQMRTTFVSHSKFWFLNQANPCDSIRDSPSCTTVKKLPPSRNLGHHSTHLFVSYLKGTTVLCCLLLNIWGEKSFPMCFVLFSRCLWWGSKIWILPHSQKQKYNTWHWSSWHIHT